MLVGTVFLSVGAKSFASLPDCCRTLGSTHKDCSSKQEIKLTPDSLEVLIHAPEEQGVHENCAWKITT